MSSYREVITLQCGHYANHVGQHFWNIQEHSFEYGAATKKGDVSAEILPDILYREGLNRPGGHVTFTPRAVIVDLQGSLRTLPQHGGQLYAHPKSEASTALCSSAPVSCSADGVAPPKENGGEESKAYNDVGVWSDFRAMNYHSRSIQQLAGYWHGGKSESEAFDVFGVGCDAWPSADDAVVNAVRQFAEECDNLDGFQLLFDADDAFSGFALSLFGHLADEYAGASVIAVPLLPDTRPGWSERQLSYREVNAALALSRLAESDFASLLVSPIKVPAERFDGGGWYESSGVAACLFDALSLPYRQSGANRRRMHDAIDMVGQYRRRIASTSALLPFPIASNASLYSALQQIDCHPVDRLPTASFTPGTTTPEARGYNSTATLLASLGGISREAQRVSVGEALRDRLPHAVVEKSAAEMLDDYVSCFFDGTLVDAHVFQRSCPVPHQIFSRDVDGFKSSSDATKRVSVLAAWHAAGSVGDLLMSSSQSLERRRILATTPRLLDGIGVDADDYRRAAQALLDMRDNYPRPDATAAELASDDE